MRRVAYTLTGLGVAIGILSALLVSQHFLAVDDIPEVSAETAHSFTDSVGIGIHAWYPPIDWSYYRDAFVDLKVNYLRDDLVMSRQEYESTNEGHSSHWIARIRDLGAMNIKTTAISDPIRVPAGDVPWYVKQAQGGIFAIEGANEPNGSCHPNQDVYTQVNGTTCAPSSNWMNIVGDYFLGTKNALKGDSQTTNTLILSPSATSSIYGQSWPIVTQNTEYANLHYYPYNLGNTSTSFQTQFAQARANLYPGKPIMVTENGFPSQARSGGRATSPALQAQMIPLYLLESYRQGAERTWIYQLVDDESAGDYMGLIKDDATKKPAYYSVRNLMMLLDDTSTPFQPGKLRYRIESPSSNVVSVLLQKQNGIFELLVYQAGLTGSPAPLPDQQVSEAKITVSFGSDIETAKIFKPNSGQNVVSTLDHPSQITNLGIGADLVLIEIKPGVSGGSSGGNNGDGSNSSGSGSGSTSNRGSSSKKSGGAAQSSTDQTTTGQGLPVASDNPPVTLPTPLEKFLPGLQVQGIRSKLYVAGVLAIFLGLAFMWTFRRLLRRKLRNWLATHGKNN